MKPQLGSWTGLLTTFALLCDSSTGSPTASPQCRCVPGDSCWPSAAEWDKFNATVGGKLIASVPLASVCHHSSFAPYNEEKCATLRSNWFDPDVHIESSSSIQNALFANNTCNPFLSPDAPCTLGNMVTYSVNASSAADFQKAIAFVRQKNIRLVIRNTGHDYNAKSTGAGALSIWTHHMKTKEVVDYSSPSYKGKAVKMGAGVQVLESYEFTNAHGMVNVGGDCPSVGVAGGYTQGGGHGPGVSKFGLGSDQALEWEVVTGTGEILTASREQNEDMFWALSGGGGGTYGVVSSLTVRAYPDLISSGASMSFALKGADADAFWDVVGTFQHSIPDITSAGCFAIWAVTSDGFTLVPANCPGLSQNETRVLFTATLDKLASHNISYDFSVKEFPNFLESYKHFNIPSKNISQTQLGSRLIPRSLVEHNNSAITSFARRIVESGNVFSGTAVNISKQGFETKHTSVDPARRDAVFSAIVQVPYNQTDYAVNVVGAQHMTYKYLPPIEQLTPNGRAYMNEADFQQPDFQKVFYGVNYPRLSQIKRKYDPDDIFYAITAVGSEGWYEDRSHGGRLCRA